jgi:hypothetical protein
MNILVIAIIIFAAIAYALFVLRGAWIDGRRQALRNKGLHPVTTPEGHVEAREQEHGRSNIGKQTEDDQG